MLPPELKDKPASITCGGELFFRIFEAKKAGLVHVAAMEVGKSNGEWVLELDYPHPKQTDLI